MQPIEAVIQQLNNKKTHNNYWTLKLNLITLTFNYGFNQDLDFGSTATNSFFGYRDCDMWQRNSL